MKLYYMTDVAELILQEGFGPPEGAGFATPTSHGGYVSDRPVAMDEGAIGDQLLEVRLPDTLDLAEYELDPDELWPWDGREWCVPASVLNRYASARLLDGEEADDVWLHSWLAA
ncbi:hypothetical protein [Actinopolymorpha singaporensis]|uniref:Uncharacterized protein n=1 Tax=Actinopolymorpha singaporensis TaxID=117157 RepID=A0A1H1U6V7_9ACTN|nr:hypothetical protein [Actinopolymorpha singaporensis]SDS68091.1 hypothetical protein SAMN04489717_3501 [Actinopolymorpha singaporensis]